MCKKIVTIILICLLLSLYGCGTQANETENIENNIQDDQTEITQDDQTEITQDDEVYSDTFSCKHPISDEYSVDQATHILDAKYIGEYNVYKDHYLHMFEPVEVYKGELTGDEASVIYVTTDSVEDIIGIDQEAIIDGEDTLVEGETYFLITQKYRSVYKEHSVFTCNDAKVWSEKYEDWNLIHDKVKSIMDEGNDAGITVIWTPYTESEDIGEIIDFASNIFIVHVLRDLGESDIGPTSMYDVKVKTPIKNTPNGDGDITITFFNDTVEVGHDYIVMLGEVEEYSLIYPLASRENSVFPVEEIDEIPELKALVEGSN